MIKTALWLMLFFGVLLWSAIHPKDYFTWFLEVFPALIGLGLMAWSYKRFPLTSLLYILILLHSIVLMVGGHYTYAEVPLFDMIRDLLDLERNNYDKVGHFMQGFAPAILAREILLRKKVVLSTGWLNYIVLSIILAFSAFYELIEWAVAEMSGEGAEAFLGTQGYVWDTQSDMAWALFGGVMALLLLSKYHHTLLQKDNYV
jgi:putative membrane protein